MKSLINYVFSAIFIVFGICTTLNGQGVVDYKNMWEMSTNHEFFLKFYDSTEVDGKIYHLLGQFQVHDTNDTTFCGLYGRHRESEGVVYAHSYGWGERELYNFNLQTGDTITNIEEIKFRVEGVDSVYLCNGERKKRLTLSHLSKPSCYAGSLIESVGQSSKSWVNAHICFDEPRLENFYINGELAYNFSCFSTSTSTNDINEVLKVYPNPASSIVHISSSQNELTSIEFIDASGNLVLTKKSTELSINIDIDNLRTGIYFLKIKSKSGSKLRKLIKI